MTVIERALTPAEPRLPAGIRAGTVTLRCADVPRLQDWAGQALGLQAWDDDGATVLGRLGRPLLRLRSEPGAPAAAPGEAGLYHVALRLPDRRALAAAAYRAMLHDPARFEGATDHLVAECFTFRDPEGNRIALVADRPDAERRRDEHGLVVDTVPLAWDRFLGEHLDEQAHAESEAVPMEVGHLHLRVGEMAAARRFYGEALGLEVIAEMGPQALVLSSAGSCPLVLSSWESEGAGVRGEVLGLAEAELTVPDAAGVEAAARRAESAGVAVERRAGAAVVVDPWGTRLVLCAAAEPAGLP